MKARVLRRQRAVRRLRAVMAVEETKAAAVMVRPARVLMRVRSLGMVEMRELRARQPRETRVVRMRELRANQPRETRVVRMRELRANQPRETRVVRRVETRVRTSLGTRSVESPRMEKEPMERRQVIRLAVKAERARNPRRPLRRLPSKGLMPSVLARTLPLAMPKQRLERCKV